MVEELVDQYPCQPPTSLPPFFKNVISSLGVTNEVYAISFYSLTLLLLPTFESKIQKNIGSSKPRAPGTWDSLTSVYLAGWVGPDLEQNGRGGCSVRDMP